MEPFTFDFPTWIEGNVYDITFAPYWLFLHLQGLMSALFSKYKAGIYSFVSSFGTTWF